jgi:hypothetical protein
MHAAAGLGTGIEQVVVCRRDRQQGHRAAFFAQIGQQRTAIAPPPCAGQDDLAQAQMRGAGNSFERVLEAADTISV